MAQPSWAVRVCVVVATLTHCTSGFSVRLDESFRQKKVSKINTVEFVTNGEETDALKYIRLLKFDETYTFVTVEWRRFPNESIEYLLELKSDNETIMRTPVATIPSKGCVPSTNWTKFNTSLTCVAKGTALLTANLSYTIRTYNTNIADVLLNKTSPLHRNSCFQGISNHGEAAGYVIPDRYDNAVLEIRKECVEHNKVNDNGSSFPVIPVGVPLGVLFVVLIIVTCLVSQHQKKKAVQKVKEQLSVKDNGRLAGDIDERYVDSQERSYRETNIPLHGKLLQALMDDMCEKWKPDFGQFVIPRASVCISDEIGKGAFGTVHVGAVLFDGNPSEQGYCAEGNPSEQGYCAVKRLHAIHSAREVEEFLQEALILKDFQHKNILGLVGVCMDREGPLVCLELMHHGDLKAFLRTYRRDHSQENLLQAYADPPTMTTDQLINFCLQIASGMAYLATKKFVHRDLAARNCLLDESLTVKIGDFGLARDVHYGNYYRMGTGRPMPVKWMALESIGDQVFTSQSDVWAFGIVMWEIFSLGLTPYPGIANHEMRDTLLSGMRPSPPYNCPASLYTVMQKCWLVEPAERPSFKELIEHLKETSPGEYENISVNMSAQPDYQNVDTKQPPVFQHQGSMTVICESYEAMSPARSLQLSGTPSEELSWNPNYHQILPVIDTSTDKSSDMSRQHYSSEPVHQHGFADKEYLEIERTACTPTRPILESDV